MPAFLGVPVVRGQVTRQRIPVAELADGSPVALPVVTIGGAQDGPVFFIQAAIHGDESTGIRICQEALARINPSEVSGTVVAIPVVNIPAYLTRTRGFLHEERWLIDINRIFPGTATGLLTERIAHLLVEDFVCQADFTLDLHAALDGCTIAPFVYVDPDDNESGTHELRQRCGYAFGTPYAFHKPRGQRFGTSDLSRSIAAVSDQRGKAVVTAEMGESRRVTAEHVDFGARGVLNVMSALGMLPPAAPREQPPRKFGNFDVVHANRGGMLQLHTALHAEVKTGDLLAEILDLFGETVEELRSPSDGFVLRTMLFASVASGAEIIWVAH